MNQSAIRQTGAREDQENTGLELSCNEKTLDE